MMIQKSIQKLAQASGASEVKFWGKVQADDRDYWIAQGVLNQNEEEPRNIKQEKRGNGVNSTVFWSTFDLREDWIQLPDVTPEHINCAKLVKYMLVGDLNASVNCMPPFPGTERYFLRAQLARIQHSTELCPKDMFAMDDDTNKPKLNEDFEFPKTSELNDLNNW